MQPGQARPQPSGNRRVIFDPFFRVDRPARFNLGQIIRQHARQLVVQARARAGLKGQVVAGTRTGAHAHARSSSTSLRRSIARAQSMRTAPDERPMRAATSLNLSPSRLRRITTSR